MPLMIHQELCAQCGSCIGNCPNRAIIRRGGRVLITDMCCDCGICTRYCSVGAIGKGERRAERDTTRLSQMLAEKLKLTRRIAAMKFVDEIPEGIAVEQGPQFWCALCGDVFDGNGEPLLFTAAASMCGGCANLGLGAKRVAREEFDAALDGQVIGEGNLYSDRDVIARNRDAFPQFPKIYKGVVVGLLERIPAPDLVLFPVNGHQLCVISTAFAFETGELIRGFAGKATCLMTVTVPLLRNRPVFCAGDHGGRMFMRLRDEEILVCFPFSLIPGLVHIMDKTVYANAH
ncbi:MAG: DUF169 domain-containing protein [Desulfobacterota bacterium]|nr:DUF169 domain-containing protein [Thermodesulfobacteriota bacterium]